MGLQEISVMLKRVNVSSAELHLGYASKFRQKLDHSNVHQAPLFLDHLQYKVLNRFLLQVNIQHYGAHVWSKLN